MCVHSEAMLELGNTIEVCVWANCRQQLHVNNNSIRKIIKVLHGCYSDLCILLCHTFNDLNRVESVVY